MTSPRSLGGCCFADGTCETLDPATCSVEAGTSFVESLVDDLLFTGPSNLQWTPLDPALPQSFALFEIRTCPVA